MKRIHLHLIVLSVLILAAMACNLGASRINPTPTSASIQPESPENLEETFKETIEESRSGEQIKLEINEQQLTSIVAGSIQEQDEPSIEEPQVLLRNGQIRFLATVERQNLALPAEVVMTVQPDANGRPDFNVVSARIGPLPVSGEVISDLESSLDQTLAAEIESRAPNTYIESIIIADGVMSITGRTR